MLKLKKHYNKNKFHQETTDLLQEFWHRNNLEKDVESLEEIENLYEDETIVIACSISRVEGKREDTVGKAINGEAVAKAVFDNCPSNINIAIQCCEHLNRALIVEKAWAKKNNLQIVSAIPTDMAGGTFAAAAYNMFKNPVLVTSIKAEYGLDIGLLMVGMHLQSVAKPVLLDQEYIGGARVIAANTRPPLIGGARTTYDINSKQDVNSDLDQKRVNYV